ncbi:MAG: hypothetical protein IJP69_07945 [Synergistaceae bacterium]|nr:hypothetical protein [Synergistaceae bacterium]MBR0233978.1 hypothetical protein [Synergistaceae bacterium]
MTSKEFEVILERCCEILTTLARSEGFKSSKDFENRVREVLSKLTANDPSIKVDFNAHAQAFPDIAMGEYGVEVKYTTADTWRSIANSVLETQRIEGVKYIYVIFGKMGGEPKVRWGEYENSVIHVRTSHVPRFEIEVAPEEERTRESLFKVMGIRYDVFRKLDMSEKMKYIRAYAKKIHPNEQLWWIDDEAGLIEEAERKIFVETYQTLGQTLSETMKAFATRFHKDEHDAEELVKKYWKTNF